MSKPVECINSKISNRREVVAQIVVLLDEINFGSIEIFIHNGKVTLIERKEKIKPTDH